MNEIWKALPEYETKYEVSNTGKIRSITREVACKGGTRRLEGKELKQQVNKRGYLIIGLSTGKSVKTYTMHQLVSSAFITNFVKGTELNHIDGNPLNNWTSNLEVSNPSHNQLHAIRLGLVKPRGASKYHHVSYISKNPRAKSRWAVCIRYKGKSCYGWKTFMTELEAAIYADELLDSIRDTERLRNFS